MLTRWNTFPKTIVSLLRSNFFAGLLVVIPFAVIAWIIGIVMGMLWQFQDFLPLSWQPDNLIQNTTLALLMKIAFTLAAAISLALAISVFGWASKQFLGRKLLELLADLIQHIPVVRSIYSALDQLLRTFTAQGGQQFNRVVYVEYPRKGLWAIAFVTSTAREPGIPPGHLNIYVPTTPNPTSGFHLIVDEKEVRDTNLKVEDAFKILLSLGIAQDTGSANHG
jgi:uncharacterized membrane protein